MSRNINNNEADPNRKERCVILGEYIKTTGATVRMTAKEFGVSKSTVHKDVSEKLRYENKRLYEEVKTVLLKNKAVENGIRRVKNDEL